MWFVLEKLCERRGFNESKGKKSCGNEKLKSFMKADGEEEDNGA